MTSQSSPRPIYHWKADSLSIPTVYGSGGLGLSCSVQICIGLKEVDVVFCEKSWAILQNWALEKIPVHVNSYIGVHGDCGG